MYVTKILAEVQFARELAAGLFREGEPGARVLARIVAKLPCQAVGPDADPCLGFRVEAQGARPCACALLKSALTPLASWGALETVLECGAVGRLPHDLMPQLAWTTLAQTEERKAAFFRFLVGLLNARIVAEGAPSSSVSPGENDLQAQSLRILDRFVLVQNLFFSDFHASFSWPRIRHAFLSYKAEGFDDLRLLWEGRSLVVVDFGALKLATSGVDVGAFEFFIGELCRSDKGLVVFSGQPLVRPAQESDGFSVDYTNPMKRSYRDANNKWRLESSRQQNRAVVAVQDVVSAGAWDRTLEALARGQHILDSLVENRV